VAAFTSLAPFGVETRDVDLSRPLSAAAFAQLERAFYANHVLALRAQEITAAQFLAFARRAWVRRSRM
jgi:taurine dioxygenase